MSMATTFDTYLFVKKLKQAGFPESQAEAISDAIKTAQSEIDFATRQDIDHLRRDMKDLDQRMAIKLGTMMVVAVGTVATLVKLLG